MPGVNLQKVCLTDVEDGPSKSLLEFSFQFAREIFLQAVELSHQQLRIRNLSGTNRGAGLMQHLFNNARGVPVCFREAPRSPRSRWIRNC